MTALAAVCLAGLTSVEAAAPRKGSAPRKGASYDGRTSQGHPVSFTVTRSGRTVRRLALEADLECQRGTLSSLRNSRLRQGKGIVRVNRDRTFSGRFLVGGGSDGDVRQGRFVINGRFLARGRRARGVLYERLRLFDGLQCESGLVHFTMRVGRRPR